MSGGVGTQQPQSEALQRRRLARIRRLAVQGLKDPLVHSIGRTESVDDPSRSPSRARSRTRSI